MPTNRYVVAVALFLFALSTAALSGNFLTGTWCIGSERLIITFSGNDSIRVSSKRDESIQGTGSYRRTDSTLAATILNEDLVLEMGYRYKKKNADMLRAKIEYITVNGESVNHPRRWMRMEKCDPEQFEFTDDNEEEDQ